MKNEQTGAQNKERNGKEKMERKKISSRIMILLLVFMMLFTMMPAVTWADEGTINVYVSVSKYGEITVGKDSAVMAYVPVTVNDLNGNGTFDIDDVLYAAHEQYYEGGAAAGYGSATSEYGLRLTKLWGDESGLFGYQVNRGTENVMGLSHEVTEGDYVDAYINKSVYPDNEGHARFDKTSAEIFEGQSLDLLLEYVSGYDDSYNAVYSPCEGATLTVDGAEKDTVTDTKGKATVSFDTAGTYILSAMKTKTVNDQEATAITAPVCKVTVKSLPDASITVPSDAELFVGSKVKHYVAFTEISAAHKSENANAGTTTYYFDFTNNSTYNYRVSGENYVTYAGTFKKTAGYSLNVTEEMLKPEGVTKDTIDRDVNSNKGYNVADVYLNINPQGYLKLDSIGATHQIVNLRDWEAVDSITNNYFIEPDYHYTVIDETGSSSSNVVTIDEKGLITAVGKGTVIVLVTYDAINIPSAAGGPFFGAIWPENTGVFVVSVGVEESGIETGMMINEGKNTTDSKLSGDAIDAEHDVIYFVGEKGEYTFTPVTDDVSVYVANPTVSDKMTFSGFKAVKKNTDGSVTVPLVEGRNIVKLEKNGKTEYQIITAKKITYTINGGEQVKAGDTISIIFDKIYNPVGKLAGVYNPTTVIMYNTVSGYEDILIGGTGSQYNFASNIAAQTVANIVTKTINAQWGTVSIKKGNTIIIPDDYAEDTFTISEGTLFAYYYGDPAGNHREITYENGKGPNLNANQRQTYLGALPDIEIPVAATDAELSRIDLKTDNVRVNYYEGETFDVSNLVVTAIYEDNVTQIATNYSVTPEILSEETKEVTVNYRGKTATIPVTVNERKVQSVDVTKAPVKTVYTVGEVFNPTGIEITATYDGGVTKDVTEDVTYYDTVFNAAGDDVKVTVSYTEKGVTKTTTQSVKVNKAGSAVPEDNISVSFTLLGDDKHGEPTDITGTHTLKNHNLKTWIPKTNVSVPEGSKVIDVIEKALGTAGIPFTNPDGNYIDTIKGLGEFSNGNISGWMYTLNGLHPNLGVAEQIVKNCDVIVLHYTDDYTVEHGSESLGTPAGTESPVTTAGASGSATTTTPTEVTVSGSTATATVKSENAAEAIKQAKEN
ncbi:MAG: DUF4430 domain-containing protein, partial [Firmicutes bacterium]|nr:DUF4430 domain-containing protein [Bacillota bacterium]